jgi:hypothetical protein
MFTIILLLRLREMNISSRRTVIYWWTSRKTVKKRGKPLDVCVGLLFYPRSFCFISIVTVCFNYRMRFGYHSFSTRLLSLLFILTCPTVLSVTKFDMSLSYPHSKHSSYQPPVSCSIKRSPLQRGQLFNFQTANCIIPPYLKWRSLRFQKSDWQRFIMDHF